ncbi:MAG: ornithine carbamoyltransferase [Verrucomicrobia bacterium]|nr:ornithine carbamoyltransferase [Verrucomicrobiota bacterium]
MKHLLSIESLTAVEILKTIDLAKKLKVTRGRETSKPLAGECWGLLFSKSSTRTRVSFEVGIRELGGEALFLSSSEIQLGRGEPIEDTARVLGRMIHGAVIRTFKQSDIETFAALSGIPTINALTDEEHPCQILADLLTIEELRGSLDGLKVAFIGDADSNMGRSWIWAAARLGFELSLACPELYRPPAELIARAEAAGGSVTITESPEEAASGAAILYTDVWVSMGKEEEAEYRAAQFARYQINDRVVAAAAPKAHVLHCLPAYRGKEITAEVFERHADAIFQQAENRLHAQKAVMTLLKS